ncbi:MAG: type II toxin-antitoxin system RelE/ParE family toxin [Acidobacteriota bacterium]|nr:type II toxin-antitoxin system RelE/ParE family toxin [Acidobacteriota bacterium]
MRIFKNRWFARYARREHIPDESLREAVARAERGLIDADLGGGLIKQRVARKGQGRSGGYRMLLAYRTRERSVFFYAFAKNERDNIEPDELQSAREIAAHWLAADAKEITKAITEGKLEEVHHDEEKA